MPAAVGAAYRGRALRRAALAGAQVAHVAVRAAGAQAVGVVANAPVVFAVLQAPAGVRAAAAAAVIAAFLAGAGRRAHAHLVLALVIGKIALAGAPAAVRAAGACRAVGRAAGVLVADLAVGAAYVRATLVVAGALPERPQAAAVGRAGLPVPLQAGILVDVPADLDVAGVPDGAVRVPLRALAGAAAGELALPVGAHVVGLAVELQAVVAGAVAVGVQVVADFRAELGAVLVGVALLPLAPNALVGVVVGARADARGQLAGIQNQLGIGGVGAAVTVVVDGVADLFAGGHAHLPALAALALLARGAVTVVLAAGHAHLVDAQVSDVAVAL